MYAAHHSYTESREACASLLHKRELPGAPSDGGGSGGFLWYMHSDAVLPHTTFVPLVRLCPCLQLCSCCREALLEDLHVVVVVGEVPSVALLVLVAGAPNFDVDLVMVVVDGIIAVVVIAVEVRLATAPF